MTRLLFGVLAYLAPTFALGFVWHLLLFENYYAALAIYRSDIIIPFGFLSMLIQAVLFAWIYKEAFVLRKSSLLSRSFIYAVIGEELGFFGCGAVLTGFLIILWRGLQVTWERPKRLTKRSRTLPWLMRIRPSATTRRS